MTKKTKERRRRSRGARMRAPSALDDVVSLADHIATDEERKPRRGKARGRNPFSRIALLLQGGGALGAYQAGVYEALAETGVVPNWVAGISIGAINAAIIAGNPPAARVDKLRAFWRSITECQLGPWGRETERLFVKGDAARAIWNHASANAALFQGVSGFFTPRAGGPLLHPWGTIEATSFYETGALKSTLERFADFDRINSGGMRFSVGAVNVSSGNFVYFDNTTRKISPEHVMASGALPPAFPPVRIDGEYYWDGALVSNTPLHWVFDSGPCEDTLIFQVDLWSARGGFPRNIAEVVTRRKEIQYSSRTRANTDWVKFAESLRAAICELMPKLPKEMKDNPEVRLLETFTEHRNYNIVHLIYRPKDYEGFSKDFEFSPVAMEEHWRTGYEDAVRALRHPEVFELPTNFEGVRTFDIAADTGN